MRPIFVICAGPRLHVHNIEFANTSRLVLSVYASMPGYVIEVMFIAGAYLIIRGRACTRNTNYYFQEVFKFHWYTYFSAAVCGYDDTYSLFVYSVPKCGASIYVVVRACLLPATQKPKYFEFVVNNRNF